MRCPDCGEVMVKVHIEMEDDEWMTAWLCGCKPPVERIKRGIITGEKVIRQESKGEG